MDETNLRARTLRLLRSAGGAWLALALLLAVCALTSAPFRNPQNLLNIVRQSSYGGIVALGMTFVIVSGGIDLSVGSLFALSGVCAASRRRRTFAPLRLLLTVWAMLRERSS